MKAERYYCEDEVGRLIQNLAQWGGDGAAVRSSASIWQRLLREVTRTVSGTIVTIGVDAGHTEVALRSIDENFASAVTEYHLSPFPVSHQAKKLGVGRATYYRWLERGHIAFMSAYRAARLALSK